ncbi:MAG TPA: hypothetical protein VM165_01215 [Planctomycetaceae bacterium]|nr:hypothetical protein [Planctomycetaceae bacterium]
MPTPSDLLADLPAPRDDEPSSLRQDILDELSDHLSCAFHRELVKSGNEQSATARVLDRFGDPRRIAFQLWFQAMWSRIMLQRVSMGLQGLLTVGVLAVAFLMFRVVDFQSRMHDEWQTLRNQSTSNQQMLTLLLQRLPQPASPITEGGSGMGSAAGYDMGMGGTGGMPMLPQPGDMSSAMSSAMSGAPVNPQAMMMGTSDAAGSMMGMSSPPAARPNLVIRVGTDTGQGGGQPAAGYFLEVQDENGQGVPGELVTAHLGEGMFGGAGAMPGGSFGGPSNGSTFSGDGRFVRMWTDQPRPSGVQYSNVQPGRYTAIVEFPDGRVGKQRFAVLPKEAKTITIACPPEVEPSLVTIVGPKLEQIDPAFEIRAGVTITRPSQRLGNTEWTLKESPSWAVWFDPATGLVSSLQSPADYDRQDGRRQRIAFDDSDPADTRFVTLKSGNYQLSWDFLLVWKDPGKAGMNLRNPGLEGMPDLVADRETQSAQPGTTTWTLPLPEALWSRVKDRAIRFSPKPPGNIPTKAFESTPELKDGAPNDSAQIRFVGPEGMVVAVHSDKGGKAPLEVIAPGRLNLTVGKTHELLMKIVPGNSSLSNVSSSLDVPESAAHAAAFLKHNAVPMQLTVDDIVTIAAGNPLTKVAYLPPTTETATTAAAVETIASSRLDPGLDAVEEAKKRGTVLAVWRIESLRKATPLDADAAVNEDK